MMRSRVFIFCILENSFRKMFLYLRVISTCYCYISSCLAYDYARSVPSLLARLEITKHQQESTPFKSLHVAARRTCSRRGVFHVKLFQFDDFLSCCRPTGVSEEQALRQDGFHHRFDIRAGIRYLHSCWSKLKRENRREDDEGNDAQGVQPTHGFG